MMALILVLSLGITASAAGGTGSIKITNATSGQTYNIYKFFNANYSSTLGSDGEPIVSYTIEPSNQFYTTMFGTDGTAANPYFDHNPTTHVVTKKSSASDQDVITYLDGLAASATPDDSIPATGSVVEFTGLATGYYLVDRGTTSTVTLTTNMPNVEIIDKNQKPGNGFDKKIDESGTLIESNSASIGDTINFRIPFTATNFHGEEQVKYYVISDSKSGSLWVEFDDVKVFVNGIELKRGYYFFGGTPGDPAETGEWNYLGNWEGITKAPDNAQWYLIHKTYDTFDIIIPWLENQTFTSDATANTYELTFAEPLKSAYDPTSEVVVTYTAAVGPDAVLGTAINEAGLSWVHTDGPSGNEDTEKTETKVYNLGITKIANDAAKTPLAGAVFALYSDSACTKPVHVIPTGEEGVYILDDVDTDISGSNRTTAREKYAGAALNTWLAADPEPDGDGTNRRNDMTTPANGQLVVQGLEAGIYYMLETEAPDGYNKLALPVALTVGEGAVSTYGSHQVYGMNVINNRGVELPSTGGEGTMMLITIGSMVAMAFAVLLITHKKMTVYHD